MRFLSASLGHCGFSGRALLSKYEPAKQRNAALLFAILFFSGAFFAFPPAQAQDEALPLPRFVSLKADEVYMRAGPGKTYPINWVYTRKGLPVEIIKEYDQWRYVRDIDGTEGWIHRTLLSGTRTVIISEPLVRTAYSGPSRDDAAVFRAEPGVQGNLIDCDGDWCRIEVEGIKGWLPMSELFGVYPEDGQDG
jgi:SH3-like domain-containing protein